MAITRKYLDQAALEALVAQIKSGDKVNADAIGTIASLKTSAKDNVVAAINELKDAADAVDYSGKADKVANATVGNFAGLDANGNLTDSGKKAADFEVAGAAKAVQGETTATVKAVEDKVNTVIGNDADMSAREVAEDVVDALKLSETYDAIGAAKAVQGETTSTVKAVEDKVTTLIGDDAAKSVRTIANEELAAQLIPESAKESLDTLKEIADWIQAHPDDASAMNAAIEALQAQVGSEAEGEKAATGLVADIRALEEAIGEGGSVETQIQAAITALDLPNTYDEKGAAAAVEAKLADYTKTADMDTFTEFTADEINAMFA